MAGQLLAVVIPLLCTLEVKAVYHELSKTSFSPPTGVKAGSLFGYSIAYQPSSRKLITSAPKFGVGSVFECSIESKKCDRIEVNGTDDYKYGNMWLGATVATGHNFTVACAPRYTESTFFLGTFGRCYAATTEPKMSEMPKFTLDEILKPYEKNMDSFGWSINVDRRDTITVGGPAMSRGRAISYSGISASPQLIKAPTGVEPNFAFGYSVTSGNFLTGNENDIVYAISSPYGRIGFGMVMLSDLTKTWYLPLPNSYVPGVGSLFGGALAAASLRGPGQRQALLIGAPTYAGKGRVDVGAVYIYLYDIDAKTLLHKRTILGKKDNAQFGSAIIGLGDLNGDRKDEIAVAAPYEDSGTGAVYIYSGGHLLSDVADSMLQSLQRIQPEGYRGFGLSLAALHDYDDNGCNELAVGAPYSDKFVLFRCIATIKVIVQRLQEQKRQNDTYFIFKSCMDFVYPEKPKNVAADIQLRVSISHKDAKLVNAVGNNKFVEHQMQIRKKDPSLCVDVGIIIPKVVGYEPSIQYQISVSQSPASSPLVKKEFKASQVLLSDLSVLNVSDTVWVADCEGKGKCQPKFNLTIQSTIIDNYTIGSSDIEKVSFSAWNSGDVAYKPYARVSLRGVRVVRLPSTCSLDDNVLDCFPKQPVEKDTLWQSEQIELDMKSLRSNIKNIKVAVTIYPTGEPKEITNIKSTRTFNLQPDYNGLTLRGSTNDEIELTKEELMETGKHTSHIYTIYNNGMTVWVNLRCIIVMDPKYYYKEFALSVDSQAPFQCDAAHTRDGRNATICSVTVLRKYQKFEIIVSFYVEPGKININDLDDDENNKITVISHLKLLYEDQEQDGSIVSAVKLKEATVPIWIVIIAALVGLLIIIIIAFVLYECGFLRRKNKDKLKRLRRSVHRQSVHRSMRISARATSASERRSGDREKLIEEIEKNDSNTDTAMGANGAETPKTTEVAKNETNTGEKNTDDTIKVTEPESNTKLTDMNTNLLVTEIDVPKKPTAFVIDTKIPKNHKDVPTKKIDELKTKMEQPKIDSNVQNESTEIPKKVADKSKIINNDHIIRGLQKNVVQNRSLTRLPVTSKEAKDASSDNLNTEL